MVLDHNPYRSHEQRINLMPRLHRLPPVLFVSACLFLAAAMLQGAEGTSNVPNIAPPPNCELLYESLGGAWQVIQEGHSEAIPATVPGCIHTDLLAAHNIPDPFYRDNEKLVQWVGEANWIYRRSFQVAPPMLARQHVLLKCEGLDTLATIRVNGVEIGHTDNMFRTYEFDVKKRLQAGSNSIEIKFDSVMPLLRAKESQRKLPTWAYPGAGYVRKEPCNFGWDWGPTLITAGIWRNLGIVAFDNARLDDVAIRQDHSRKGPVTLGIAVEAGPAGGAGLKVKVAVALGAKPLHSATAAVQNGRANLDIAITDPQLWWPAGMGAQPLYTVRVELLDGQGKVLDVATKRIGLRTLRAIAQTKDAPLHFEANGIPFFAKGANWIPADCFVNRVTKEILHRYVEDAVAANMNSLRFWGGGYYEDDALFDFCDEMGLCIWLDFKFGCTTYPAFDEAFLDNVKVEARENVKRLRHHPSIALWCGNNEIMFFRGKDQWTADKMSAGDYYKLFRDTLGDQVRQLSPQTDYVTGSPDCGDVHFWEVWHGGKPFEVYRDIHGFVSEFGFQSFPEPKTVALFTQPADRASVYSPVMKYHERSNRMYMDVKEDGTIGTDKIMKLVKKYFHEPKDFDSTLWLSQITQGFGIQYGAEGWRREMPKSMGCVYWQYNDCWPCSSWASVDYCGRWKALQYLAQRFYAPLLVSAVSDARTGKVDIHVTSDRLADCQGKVAWTVTDVSGRPFQNGSLNIEIPARQSRKVQTLDVRGELHKKGPNNVLVWLKLEVGGVAVSDNLAVFVYPRELPLVDPKLAAQVSQNYGEFRVRLQAEHPALWAWLELDGLDARYSQNFVHVAEGTPVEIQVRPAQPLAKEAFEKALRIRSLYNTYSH
jgi:beta-mannosidase